MRELDRLCFSERVRQAARLPRVTDAVLDELGREHPYLALVAARHAGRTDRLLAALLDPRVSVTRPAVALLRTVEPLPDLDEVLPRCCSAVRAGLLSVASERASPEQAARLLSLVEERYGPGEAVHLLRALSPEDLERHLPRLAPRLSNWAGLARRHPDAVLRWLRQRLESAPDRERSRHWQRLRPCLRALGERRPAELLALAADLHPPETVPPLPLSFLARTHPEEVATLLERGDFPPIAHLRRLGLERLARLARRSAHAPERVAAILAGCPPSWRAELFQSAYGESDSSARMWPARLLEVLPHELRVREAERMLNLRAAEVSPEVALETAVFASPDSAERLFEPECRAALAEERARGVAGWIRNAALSRSDLGSLLARLGPRLKNEQDPVRAAACAALRQAPASLFSVESLGPLGALVEAVTQARDTSWSTRYSLQELGLALLRRGALDPKGPWLAFSLDMQRKLVQQSGALAWPRLADLPLGTETALFEALQRWVKAANERDAYGPVLSLAAALGKRARRVEGLQKLIAQATQAKPDWVAMQAIGLWLDDPSTRDRRVRQLLDRDESTITLARVLEHCNRRRQEWLDPFLKPRKLKGRFASKTTLYLLPVQKGFHRWLPRQQKVFAGGLALVAQDSQRSDVERAHALRRLSRIPAVGLEDLQPFLLDPHVPIVEASLAAASHLDRPAEALELLLGHLDGDRARVAMYAVPRVARFTPPSVLGQTLKGLLARERLKVTVHKEVLRLLGAHRVPGTSAVLEDQWARPDLHRDVRIAVLHAARALQDWALLERAAHHDDGSVARSLLDERPDGLGELARQRYAGLVMAVAFHADARAREAAYRALPAWAVGREDDAARVLARGLLELGSGPEWKAACSGLVEVTRDGAAWETLRDTVGVLLSQPREPNAGEQRDVPAYQRWLALEHALAQVEWRKRKARGPLPGPVLLVAGLAWPELPGAEELDRSPEHSQEILAAFERELADPAFPWEEATAAYARLVAGGTVLRRLAVRLAVAAGRRTGWQESWRNCLRGLRANPDPVVRAEAWRHFTVTE